MSFKLFDFAWIPDFKNSINELQSLAMKEDWGYKSKRTANEYPILVNYIHHTFSKISEEEKIEENSDFCIFNTGLVTENQEEIFGFFQKNKNPKASSKWFFKGWRKASDRDLVKFSKLPETANYIKNAADLIYDSTIELRINIDHIIEDNKTRFPAPFNTMANHLLGNILQ